MTKSSDGLLLTEAVEQFIRALDANGHSPHTISCYRRDLLCLQRFAGDVTAADLTPDLLNRFVLSDQVRRTAKGAHKSDTTIGRTKAALRSFGRYLANTGALSGNPAQGLTIKRSASKQPAYLGELERKRVLRALNSMSGPIAERDRLMLGIFLGTGIRLAELVGLDIDDVLLEEKHLRVRVKGGRTETRFLSTDLRRRLRKYLRSRAAMLVDSEALFLSNRECRISTRQVQARCKLWFRLAGIEQAGLSVHSLRHTFGTRLYRRTGDLVLVGRALGHRSVETTRVYTHVDDDALEDALESL